MKGEEEGGRKRRRRDYNLLSTVSECDEIRQVNTRLVDQQMDVMTREVKEEESVLVTVLKLEMSISD